MAVTSSDAFLQVLKKSKLLPDEEFEEILQKYGNEGDPKSIARTLIKVGIINKWQALQLLAGRHALTLGKYKLLDQIGSDQKARAFLAEHTQMGRRVAIKTLSSQHATENPKSVKRFLDQASRLAALDHRNIVHVYDVDSQGDRHYVVLEHVEGCNLKEMLDEQGAMPVETVARYVSQAAAGLAYAQKKDHIHGDLRPANLWVDAQDVVKVAYLDVRGLGASEQDERDAVSAAYVSPEGTAGDHRSDIYSLGCVMYALLTGHPPSVDASPSLLDDRPDVPEPLVTICERMMANAPAERLQTAGEVERQLQQWLESPGDAGSPGAAGPPPRKTTQDKKSSERQKPPQIPKQPQVDATVPSMPPKPPAAETESKKPIAAAAGQDMAETKAKPAVGGGGNFAINTKRRRRRKKMKVAYLIGAVAGGLALIVGVILLLVFVVFADGEGVEVAEAGNGEASAEDATDVTGAGPNGESDPEIDFEIDPVMDAEVDPAPAPDGGSVTDGAGPDADTGSTDNGESVATASKPADEPGSSDTAGESDIKEGPTESKAEDSGAAKAPTKTPDADEQKPAKKEPAEKKPAEKPSTTKPDTKKSPTKKQPAAPTHKPFAKFPQVVSLPDLDSANATSLGPVYAASDELCYIKLRGGENAAKGPQRFVMRNADDGLAERDWEVSLREGESGPETKIAHLSLGDNSQLSFAWQPEAKSQPLAAHLTNCALRFSCRGESHIALLRKPTRADGLAVDLEKSTAKEDWVIDVPPDASAVRVEITGVQGAKYTVDPATIDADRGEAWVKLEDGGGLLSLKVETSFKRAFQVTLTPHVKLSPDGQPTRLNVREVQQFKTQAQAFVQKWRLAVNQCNQALRAKQVPEDQKKRLYRPRLATAETELKRAETALQKCVSFEKVLKDVSLTVNLRVFCDADSTEVDLLRIGG